jgi:hypothetical protein
MFTVGIFPGGKAAKRIAYRLTFMPFKGIRTDSPRKLRKEE